MVVRWAVLLSVFFAAASFCCVKALSTAPSHEFQEVRPKLWRYNGEFAFIPSPAARTPVAVWLIEVKSAWIMIDAGAASPEYSEPFLKALKQKLSTSNNPLRLIMRKAIQPVGCPLPLHAQALHASTAAWQSVHHAEASTLAKRLLHC